MAASLIDYVALDLKADLNDWPDVLAPAKPGAPSPAENVLRTLTLLKNSGFPSEFRTTCARPFVTSRTVLALAKLAKGRVPWRLQLYRPGIVSNPEFMAQYTEQNTEADLLAFQSLASEYLPCHIN
jgi:pyruvate formate lyase activating enzyme